MIEDSIFGSIINTKKMLRILLMSLVIDYNNSFLSYVLDWSVKRLLHQKINFFLYTNSNGELIKNDKLKTIILLCILNFQINFIKL